MHDALVQSLANLRANKLRSFLTMFGLLWGIVSIVVLSATGEGFRRGNEAVLREFGKNIAIVWGGRTSLQAGGERAGRVVILTVEDARAIAAQSRMVRALSPEIQRAGVQVKSRYNAAASMVHGVEPPYQDIRTIDLEHGRHLNWRDEEQATRVALVGDEMGKQLFGSRNPVGEPLTLNGMPFTVVGKLRKKNQDSDYSGRDKDKIFIPFATMLRDLPRPDAGPTAVSQIIVAPHQWVIDGLPSVLAARTARMAAVVWPLEGNVRAILARRHNFDPADREAVPVWDTGLETLLFDRIIQYMKQFFTIVGLVTLALGGIGLMNIMLIAVRERTREIGVRKALGATTRAVERQFFLEGFFLTAFSGGAGMVVALGLCALVNLAPMPERFSGMIVTWQTVALALGTLTVIGIVTSTYPARRAAELPPVDALRYEM
ncbi:MAG: ABC transporter permease [Acidobacteria bacterium]|nr:ABC transporter permease [Acidobacteriota bacterium]